MLRSSWAKRFKKKDSIEIGFSGDITNDSNTPKKRSSAVTTDSQRSIPAPWKALFFFTTRSHTIPLLCGFTSAVLSGVTAPAQSLLLGKAFGLFTQYAAGGLSGNEFLSKETNYVCYMLAVGGGSWLVHSIFFTSWIAFGELQAKSARDRLFHGMLRKDIEWYDIRKNGVGALIPRLQMYVGPLFPSQMTNVFQTNTRSTAGDFSASRLISLHNCNCLLLAWPCDVLFLETNACHHLHRPNHAGRSWLAWKSYTTKHHHTAGEAYRSA